MSDDEQSTGDAPAIDTKAPVVSAKIPPEDYARLVKHHERMAKAAPLQPIGLSFATREAIHKGLDAMDKEAEPRDGDLKVLETR